MTPTEAAADPDAYEDSGPRPEEVWDEAPPADEADALLPAVPTELSGLGWTNHFARRVMLDDRPPSPELAWEAYREGEWRGWNDRGIKRVHRMDGVDIVFIVGLSERLVPYMVTAYPVVEDVEEALASDRFKAGPLSRAAAVSQVKSADPLDDGMKPVVLEKGEELEMHGHRLISYRGATYMRCVDCGRMMKGQSDLLNHGCV
jgi:hypothetical protein